MQLVWVNEGRTLEELGDPQIAVLGLMEFSPIWSQAKYRFRLIAHFLLGDLSKLFSL